MKKYNLLLTYITMSFLNKKQFTINQIFTWIGYFMSAIFDYFLWLYLLNETSNQTMTKQEMLPYTIFVFITSICINQNSDYLLSKDIFSGDFSIILTRPISIFKIYSYQAFSECIFSFLTMLLPVYLVYICFTGFHLVNCIFWIISLLMSFILTFLIDILFGLFTIHLMNNWGINTAKSLIISLLSGELIPIFFFSSKFQLFYQYSPFYFLNYACTKIIMNKSTILECLSSFGIGICWIGILSLIVSIIYKKERRGVTINGG